MPAYRFEALEPGGQTRHGMLEADTAKAARASVRAQGLTPLAVELVANPGGAVGDFGAAGAGAAGQSARRLFQRRVLNATGLAVWTRQLAGLVAAGLPLERALAALGDESTRDAERSLVATLKAEVNAGSPFAKALAVAPGEFDETYRAVVAAGEQSGALDRVLESLADELEAQQTLRSKVMAAMLYPAIVSVIALAVVIFLVTYVVPQVATVFSNTQRALPLLTVLMVGLSALVRQWWWLGLGLTVGGVLAFRTAMRSEAFATRVHAAWLRAPIAGRLVRGYNAARFAGTLALLAAAGVPILKALQAAGQTLSNRAMRTEAEAALALVREGAPLGSALATQKTLPPLLAMFARQGEQTGRLPAMLQRAAGQLSAEVQRRALALATIIEPLMVVGMGAVVMVIVLAVLLPIIQLNTFVR